MLLFFFKFLINGESLVYAPARGGYYRWVGERFLSNICTMGCPAVRGDNPRALASGLSYVQVDKHGITIIYHLHQWRH